MRCLACCVTAFLTKIGPAAISTVNLAKVPVFSPSENHTSAFFQLRSLDLLPAEGLSEGEFWRLFSRCAVCQNFMTTRTIPYHQCSIGGELLYNLTLAVSDLSDTWCCFIRLSKRQIWKAREHCDKLLFPMASRCPQRRSGCRRFWKRFQRNLLHMRWMWPIYDTKSVFQSPRWLGWLGIFGLGAFSMHIFTRKSQIWGHHIDLSSALSKFQSLRDI